MTSLENLRFSSVSARPSPQNIFCENVLLPSAADKGVFSVGRPAEKTDYIEKFEHVIEKGF